MKVRIAKRASCVGFTVDIPDDAVAITIARDNEVIDFVWVYWLEKVEEVAVNEREQVREAIAKRIRCYYFHGNEDIARSDEAAAEILALKWPDGSFMLVATDLDQHLPENPYDVGPYNYYLHGKSNSYYQAQQDMLKAGWVKKAEGG